MLPCFLGYRSGWGVLGRKRFSSAVDLSRSFVRQLLDEFDEIGMLQSRNQERPSPGALGLHRDLLFLRFREPAARRPLQGLYVQADLLRQQPVDRSPQLKEFIDSGLALLEGRLLSDLVDEQGVKLGVLRLFHPMESQEIAEQ